MRETTFFIGTNSSLAKKFGPLSPSLIHDDSEIMSAISSATSNSIWIVSSSTYLEKLVKLIKWPMTRKLGRLIILDHVRSVLLSESNMLFKDIVFKDEGGKLLAADELAEVLSAENRNVLAIAGIIDHQTRTLLLFMGDFSHIIVPLSCFEASHSGTAPKFEDFEITDYGNTLKFGNYEASTESVLYEFDEGYRKRLNKKRKAEELGFGPSLRRLRIQKGYRRTDFQPLSEKTIARIERGEIDRASFRDSTIKILEEKLEVQLNDIESY